MGASQSKTAVDVVNDSIISVVINNVNSCSSSLTQTQQVSFGGFGLFTSASQSATLNVQCLQNINMTNQLSTQIAQQIQQDAVAQSIALLPSYSGSTNTTNLANYIQSKVTTNTIQQCAASAVQSQQVAFNGIQIGSAATQTLSLFSKCMQTVLNNNNVSQGLVQDVTQTATATSTNPLSFLSGIFGSITSWIIIGIVMIIAIIAYMFSGGSSAAPQALPPPSPEMIASLQTPSV